MFVSIARLALVVVSLIIYTSDAEELSHQRCGVTQAINVVMPQSGQTEVMEMLTRWSQHPLAAFGHCFSYETYDVKNLRCERAGARGRANCDIANRNPSGQPEVLFVPADRGIAFNEGQRMVLPLPTTIGLFAHEFAHWLGFVDEYPMSAALANDFCSGKYQHASLNVVVTTDDSVTEAELQRLWRRLPWRHAVAHWRDIATPQANGLWRLGTPTGSHHSDNVGLYPAATCAATDYYAWRPVNVYTPMQYHDIAQWPKIYLELLTRWVGFH